MSPAEPIFASTEEARDTLETLLQVINDSVKQQHRMTQHDIRQLVRGGPAELKSDLAHHVGNLLITAVHLGEEILPSKTT